MYRFLTLQGMKGESRDSTSSLRTKAARCKTDKKKKKTGFHMSLQ
jgi:hypothetical protein